MHDAYLINVPDEPKALQDTYEQIQAATTAATNDLFPGLAVRIDTEILPCFAKDGKVNSFKEWLAQLEEEEEACAAV